MKGERDGLFLRGLSNQGHYLLVGRKGKNRVILEKGAAVVWGRKSLAKRKRKNASALKSSMEQRTERTNCS